MNRRNAAPLPEAIIQLQRQLDQFRSTQPVRTKLPDSLWQTAVDLARQHGIFAVAHPPRLDYTRLKQRTAAAPPEAGDKKYDETAVSMMAVLRYGTGVPWNRIEGLEANFGIPLPAAA